MFGGSCRSSERTNIFKLRRAAGRPELKKFNEPALAVASSLPEESTATAKLCVPPPSMPIKTDVLRLTSVNRMSVPMRALPFSDAFSRQSFSQIKRIAHAREFVKTELFVKSLRARVRYAHAKMHAGRTFSHEFPQ